MYGVTILSEARVISDYFLDMGRLFPVWVSSAFALASLGFILLLVNVSRKLALDGEEDEDPDFDDDDEFTPGNTGKKKARAKPKHSLDLTETGRAALHTLDEEHAHILSASFDANRSFLADFGFDLSSSQIDPGNRLGSFAFGNDFFDPNEQLDLGLGDFDDGLNRDFADGLSGHDTG